MKAFIKISLITILSIFISSSLIACESDSSNNSTSEDNPSINSSSSGNTSDNKSSSNENNSKYIDVSIVSETKEETGFSLEALIQINSDDLKLTDFGISWLPASQSDDASTGEKIWSNNSIFNIISQETKSANFTALFTSAQGEINYCIFVNTVNESTKEESVYYSETRTITLNGNSSSEEYSLSDIVFENISETEVTLSASIESATELNPSDFTGAKIGFCYCETCGQPTINDNTIDLTEYAFANQGKIIGKITDLTNDVSYSVSAFLKLASGEIIYGNYRNFTTNPSNDNDEDSPDSLYIINTDIQTTSFSIKENIIINSGIFPIEVGICYSKSPSPTIDGENSKCINTTEIAQKNDGYIEKVLVENLDPNTTYYVRGYWIFEGNGESNDASYSDEIIVTTEKEK